MRWSNTVERDQKYMQSSLPNVNLIISKYDKNIPYTLKKQRMIMLLNDVLLYMYVHVFYICKIAFTLTATK